MAVSFPNGLDRRRALLGLLATGEPRDGAWLARELRAARSQIDADIEELRARGVDIGATAPSGVRLAAPLELLDADRILALLAPEAVRSLHHLEVLFEVDSTNTRLLGRAAPPEGRGDAALAELQLAGRGRQGRRWIAPFGASLALSLGWTIRRAEGAAPTLSLAVGVAVSRALARVGARHIGLKWPNDIWFDDRKVGGVLIEAKSEGAATHVVVGVGLNLVPTEEVRRAVGNFTAAALAEACPAPLSRNALAAALLEELLSMLQGFERRGFGAFRDEWRSIDALAGRPARVLLAGGAVEGIARGVDEDGALLMEVSGELRSFISGEASLRLNEDAA